MSRQLNDFERSSLKEFNNTLLRSFTCSLTGDKVSIYLVDGVEIALNK